MEELYLGSAEGERLLIDRDDLTTHALVVGRTGSGKTGLIHVLVEEATLSGASVVVLDPKGDLTNLLLAFPSGKPQEFAPWVPSGKNPVDEAARWVEGLKETGQDLARVAAWKNAASFNIYTPGYTRNGQGVNLLPSFEPPIESDVPIRESAIHFAMSILSAVGVDAENTDPRCVYLTEMLLLHWTRGEALPLERWPELILTPPEELEVFDNIGVADFFPKKDRMKLATAIVGFRRQASKWLEGPALDMNNFLLPGPDGRPRVTIFTLRHLNHDDRMLFTSMFLNSLVDWMFKAPASGRLRALCVLDEAAGYLPPHPLNPPTKRPICTLLAQGRAQGLGVVIGTQNPNDIDYKALSNVGTWFVGSLRERDLQRDLINEIQNRGVEASALLNTHEKTFMTFTKSGGARKLQVRWPLSYLRGPVDVSEIGKLASPVSTIAEPIPYPKLGKRPPTRKKDSLYGDITLRFTLTDDDSEVVNAKMSYSIDNGDSWSPCTMDESTPLTDLQSSPTGIRQSVVWNSETDLGCKFHRNVLIQLQIIGRDGLLFPPFDVANHVLEEPSSY